MSTVARQELPKPGNIIVLNGTSSSGKTSLARALQVQFKAPVQHLQLNSFRSMEPEGYWDGWEHQPAESVALKLAALCRAMNAALAEYSRHGLGVIFDTVLSNRDAWRYVLEDLDGLPVYLICVTCGAEELSRRELLRGDRGAGLAASQIKWIHADKDYDFRLDTTSSSSEQCAAEVVRWLSINPVPNAFKAMRSRFQMASAGD